MDAVRCPYCIEQRQFKLMALQRNNVYSCDRCAHLARPDDADFACYCPKCRDMSKAPENKASGRE